MRVHGGEKVADRSAITAFGPRREPRRCCIARRIPQVANALGLSDSDALPGGPPRSRRAVKWWWSAVAGVALTGGAVFAWPIAGLGQDVVAGGGALVAASAIGQVESMRADRATRHELAAAVKAHFRGAKLFTDAWYGDHPAAWRPVGDVAVVTGPVTWDAVATWLAVVGDPVYYGYGENVAVTDEGVYFDGQRAASGLGYAQAATELAAAGATAPAKKARWRSLGIFALVPPQRSNARAYVNVAVTPTGRVRGTYVDALTQRPVAIVGAVDRAYQRVAWTAGERGTTVFDTGLDNLTRRAAPLLVHFETERIEQWLTIRVAVDDLQVPPATPADTK